MASKEKEVLTPLWSRLTFQIQTSRNIGYNEAKNMAKNILIKRGHLHSDGTATFDGAVRGLMSPEERAIDRSIKRSGGNYNDYKYNTEKNYAYKKNKWNPNKK